MPRQVSASEKMLIIKLMTEGKDGTPMGQRDIERETGLSRPFIRKLARQIGHKFDRNGIEILGQLCMCGTCGVFFRKPPSKVLRAKRQFCDLDCKQNFFKGKNHSNWKDGRSVTSFSTWAKNQSQWSIWRQAVLDRDGNKCVISGRTDNLQAHHILAKNERSNPEKVFDVDNGITICFEVHSELHSLISNGVAYDDAWNQLKEKYNNKINV